MGSSILTSNCTIIIMRCSIVVCVASMVGLSTASYYVQGHQQMPVKYYVSSGHQHYIPQPQVIPSINLDMDYSPSVAFPGHMPTAAVHIDGTTSSVFGSRSGGVTGSVTNVDACQAPKELAKDAVEANLNVLETLSKTNLDEATKKAIYGQDEFQSRRGGSCGFIQIGKCTGSVTSAVRNCINTIGDGVSVDSVIGCVEEFIGSRSDCMGCVCRFLGLVTKNRLRC